MYALKADSQILQVELEQCIREHKVEAFKSGYETLAAEYTSADERFASLASFERVVQETKREQLAELATVLKRSIRAYWPFAKCMVQGTGALCSGILGVMGVYGFFFGRPRAQGGDKGDPFVLGLGSVCIAIALPLAYCANKNCTDAFHKDISIKRNIESLNEIMAFIEAQKVAVFA